MDKSQFSIIEAVKNAYLFTGREWAYLLKTGTLPMLMQTGTAIFIQFARPEASNIEAYLWGLPATMLFTWFMFLEVRLLLLGERLDQLPDDPVFLEDRKRSMKLAVITALLFNMTLSAASLALMATMTADRIHPVGFLVFGLIFWGLRFGVLPILAAVHFPFRPFLQRVAGLMFSLRLFGMGLVCLFPVIFLFQLFTMMLIGTPTPGLQLTDVQQLAISVAGGPLSLAISALLNAAGAYALKQILGTRQNGVLA